MKKMIFILMIPLLCCKSGNYSVAKADQKEQLVYYSKGPCLGNCPVYDFWVFKDGTFLYKDANKSRRNNTVRGRLAPDKVNDLMLFLKTNLEYPTLFRRIRDKPITILRFEGMEFEYYSTKVDGGLKEADTRMMGMIKRLSLGRRSDDT